MFILFEIIGGAIAVAVIVILYPAIRSVADDAVVPHRGSEEVPASAPDMAVALEEAQ
jgi:hypothetical protein